MRDRRVCFVVVGRAANGTQPLNGNVPGAGQAKVLQGLLLPAHANLSQSPPVPALNLTDMLLFIDEAAPLSEGAPRAPALFPFAYPVQTGSVHRQGRAMPAGFLVPAAFISDQANSIGISSASWQACFQCGHEGECLRVDGGSPSDQFSAFRGTTLASLMSSEGADCAFQPRALAPMTARRPVSQATACSTANSTLVLTIMLDGSTYGLQEAVPSPGISVLEYGAQFWAPGSNTTALYATLSNWGSAVGTCRVVPTACCLAEGTAGLDCTSVVAQPSAAHDLAVQQGLFLAPLASAMPPALELTGGCEVAIECNASPMVHYYSPFWRAAVPAAATPADLSPPWPATAFTMTKVLISMPTGLAGQVNPASLRVFNLRQVLYAY